jgi:hypothetical protein
MLNFIGRVLKCDKWAGLDYFGKAASAASLKPAWSFKK